MLKIVMVIPIMTKIKVRRREETELLEVVVKDLIMNN